jgi:hypothetical protein
MNDTNTGWTPTNKAKAAEETPFLFFGTMNFSKDENGVAKNDMKAILVYGKGTILVYGKKAEKTAQNPKPREPQSRRAPNAETFAKMLRGECGIGQAGVDALLPLPGDREVVDVRSFGDEGCPFREEYVAACKTVMAEMGEEAPDWLKEDANALARVEA